MKAIKILISIFTSITILAMLQGCCSTDYTITSGGSIFAYELVDSNQSVMTDTIQGQFYLEIGLNKLVAMNNSNNPFINSAMAFQCKETTLNSLDENNMTLTINKELIINGDTILENENLLNLEFISLITDSYFGSNQINFTKEFFDNTTVENGKCIFKFNAETTDNIKVSIDKELYIDL